MDKNDEKLDIKIPESTLNAIREAQESYKRVAETIKDIVPKLPNIDIPKFQLPEVPKFLEEGEFTLPPSPDIIREENAWERHKEILDIQNSLLKIQSEVLEEQKSNTKLTQWVLRLTIFGIIIAVISLGISILK